MNPMTLTRWSQRYNSDYESYNIISLLNNLIFAAHWIFGILCPAPASLIDSNLPRKVVCLFAGSTLAMFTEITTLQKTNEEIMRFDNI